MNLVLNCATWMREYMTISAMAIFRFPVEIGESNERDRRLNAIVSSRFEERVDNKFWVIVKYRIEYNDEKWSAIWAALNIYSGSWVQSLSKTLYTRCKWIYIAVSDPFGFSVYSVF